MTDRELMQQALDALTTYDGTNGESKRKRVLAALRERLAEPLQEHMTKETVTPPQDRMYVAPETGDLSIGFNKPSAFAEKTGAIWDASAPVTLVPHPAFERTHGI